MNQSNKIREESRTHARYVLGDDAIARVHLSNNQAYPLMDISYSGFSLGAKIERLSGNEIRLEVLGQSVNGHAKLVHNDANLSGFCFEHHSVETLVFLQPFIERLRCGASMVKMSKDVLNEKYQKPNVLKYSGDGPTDLLVKYATEDQEPGDDADIASLLLTFKDRLEYKELRFREGQVHTGRQLDNEGLASRMSETMQFDRANARQGAAIIAGIQDMPLRHHLQKILRQIAKQLNDHDTQVIPIE